MRLRDAVYFGIVTILLLLNLVIYLAPLFAMLGYSQIASLIYNFFIPLDHQYIYRSLCLFESNSSIWVSECISHNEKNPVIVKTEFTRWQKNYDGIFVYNKADVGLNRADVVYKRNSIGYKFPVCARDTGFYIALLLGVLLYKKLFPEENYFGLVFLILAASPIAIDGFFQLLTPYESTVIFRFTTGIISGFLIGILIAGNYIYKITK